MMKYVCDVPDCKNEQTVKSATDMGIPMYGPEMAPPIPFGWGEIHRMEEHDPYKDSPIDRLPIRMLEVQGRMLGDAGEAMLDIADEMKDAQRLARPKPIPIIRKYLVCDLHLLPIKAMK